jgi:UDP-N-acetylmuramate dehydrogenase
LQLHYGISLRPLNTFRLEARASRFVRLETPGDLLELYSSPEWLKGPRFVIGGGSNLLLTQDLDALVMHMVISGRALVQEDESAWYVRAAAGENWDQFVEWTLAQGYPGLENLVRIPGTVGAAPIQNIGAYGVELTDRVHEVEVFDVRTGLIERWGKDQCVFGYRDSIFKHEMCEAIVLGVTLRLAKRWRPMLEYGELRDVVGPPERAAAGDIARAVARIRSAKLPDPAEIGNAGSFFKNPVVAAQRQAELLAQHPTLVSYLQRDGRYKLAAAWLIEQCGWKGRSMGRAAVHERQSLVLTNQGDASGREVLMLARAIADSVRARFAIELEPELVVI